MDEKIMKETGKLGFGLMRLPHKGLSIDIEQTSKMVDMFIEGGGTYFDTAYVYQGSEAAAKKALVERYPAQREHARGVRHRKDGQKTVRDQP